MKTKKKILILAYSNLNFGDDMFVMTLCNRYPNQKFVLEASDNYKNVFENLTNLKIVNSCNSLIVKCIKKIDNLCWEIFKTKPLREIWIKTNFKLVVYVIGALFDEDSNWKQYIEHYGANNYAKILWCNSCVKGVPFYILGCNMTRVSSQKYIECMNYCFSKLSDICFRDVYSYNLFSHLGNVRYAPDIVLNYRLKVKAQIKNRIVISVWGVLTKCDIFPQWKWAENYWKPYRDFIRKIISQFIQKGLEVDLLALCQAEGDTYACEEIIRDQNYQDKVNIFTYNGNLNETIQIIGESKFIIGSRFHSIIMAFCTERPVFPIVYESKTEQLLNDIDYHGKKVNIKDIGNYSEADVIEAYNVQYILENEQYFKEAARQFLKLDAYLEG